jgi:eukaryotic-like serine/threonine-protein kinase
MDNLLNQTLKRYRLAARLGSGGMGAVYKGLDLSLDREVAIKIMHPQYAEESTFRQRFLQEARVAANLDHPGIVKVYDFDESQGILFIVMEFIAGMNLSQWLDDQRAADCWISVGDAVELVRQVALALQHAHERGVLHRDIKPGNIMIKLQPADRLAYRPVITDLGLAKLAEGIQITRQGESMGTPAFMSPEQAMGEKVDGRSDVYSLGVLLYQLTVGQLPFASKSISEAIRDHTQRPPPLPSKIQPGFPPQLEGIILHALEKEPDRRYPSALAFANALEDFLQGMPDTLARSTLIAKVSSQDLGTILSEKVELERGESIFDAFEDTPSGAAGDFIQVHTPGQPDRVYPLVLGTTSIGRDPENDIVLDDSAVSRVHTHVVFDGVTCKVIDQNSSNGTYLAKDRLLAGVGEDWTPGFPLRIGNQYLRLKFVEPTQHESVRSLAFQPLSVSQSGRVGVTLDPLQLKIEPGQPSRLRVEVKNQGPTVDHYRISVDGIPAAWVKDPPGTVQLMPEEVKTVFLCIQPPRHPKSRAGRHTCSVRVAGQSSQVNFVEQKISLTISAYSQFAVQLHPQKVRSGAFTQLNIENQGNIPETFTLAFVDPGEEVRFVVSQPNITIPEGQHASVKVSPRVRKTKWFGGETSYPFTAKISTTAGNVHTQNGEVVARGLIPVWMPPAVLMLCALLVGAALFLPPVLFPTPTPTPGPDPSATPEPGSPVLEEWCVYPEGDEPGLFTDCPVQVKAAPGQRLIIRWRVRNAEKLTISPLGDQAFSGQIAYEMREAKTITLKATNEDKILEKSVELIVVQLDTPVVIADTATPAPLDTVVPTVTSVEEEKVLVKITGFDMVDMQTGWAEWLDLFGVTASLLRTMDGGNTWQDVTPPDGYPIGSLFYSLDGQRLWAIPRGFAPGYDGRGGTVWRTSDGGDSWQESSLVQPSMPGYNILPYFTPRALYFLDGQHGWLVVSIDYGMMQEMLVILATADGGQSWEQVADNYSMQEHEEGVQPNAPMPCQVNGITFADAQRGYMAGDCLGASGDSGFTVLSTFDGGRTWLAVFTNPVNLPEKLMTAIAAGDAACGATGVENTPGGILVQHSCTVQASPDEWEHYKYLSLLPWGSSAWTGWPGETASFVSASEGYSLGQRLEAGTRILSRTADGGNTWQEVRSVTWQEAWLDFLAPGQGFTLALKYGDQTYDSVLVRTEDGGTKWTLVEGVLK